MMLNVHLLIIILFLTIRATQGGSSVQIGSGFHVAQGGKGLRGGGGFQGVLHCLIMLVYIPDTTAQGVFSVNCFVYLYKCSKLAGWTVIKIGTQIAATGWH